MKTQHAHTYTLPRPTPARVHYTGPSRSGALTIWSYAITAEGEDRPRPESYWVEIDPATGRGEITRDGDKTGYTTKTIETNIGEKTIVYNQNRRPIAIDSNPARAAGAATLATYYKKLEYKPARPHLQPPDSIDVREEIDGNNLILHVGGRQTIGGLTRRDVGATLNGEPIPDLFTLTIDDRDPTIGAVYSLNHEGNRIAYGTEYSPGEVTLSLDAYSLIHVQAPNVSRAVSKLIALIY